MPGGLIKKIKNFLELPPSLRARFFEFFFNKIYVGCFYKRRLKKCGVGNVIGKPLFWTPENISLGDNVLIWPSCRFESIQTPSEMGLKPELVIGSDVSFQQNCHVTFAGLMTIGSNSTISFNVSIQDTDHDYRNIDMNVMSQPLLYNSVEIGEYSFIGAGARILAGTKLGKQCIVGSNSVVRGVFPDYCVIAGSPARILKKYDAKSQNWMN